MSPIASTPVALIVLALVVACTDAADDGSGNGRTSATSSVASTADAATAATTTTTGASSGSGAGGGGPATFDPGEDRPGGDTTVDLRDATAFLQPAANIAPARRGRYEAGLALFQVGWTVGGEIDRDGLGPTYDATSCLGCHARGGRGLPPPEGHPMTTMLVRLSVPDEKGGLVLDPRYGDQIQHLAIPGVAPEGWFSIELDATSGAYADGEAFTLVSPRPVAHDLAFGPLLPGTRLSARVAQPMIGLGLLAAIDDADIQALADPDDANGDGIRGRRNRLSHPAGGTATGRFGWKANQIDLALQTAAAFSADMGITSPIFPDENCPAPQMDCADAGSDDLDIDAARLEAVVFFSHLVAVPHRPDAQDPEVLRGKALFDGAGCTACHRPSFVTGTSSGFPELDAQLVFPYTDLLLHDMGDGLADERPDGEAGGRDFRTPPLWGVGLTELVSGQARFLHDGRARTIAEAILWHGGEAEGSRERFRQLDAGQRAALIRFVTSL